MTVSLPYESEAVRAVTGPTIRPGGIDLTRRATDYCGLGAGDRVLDVGCGTGATIDFLRQQVGARAMGIDLSAILLNAARQKGGDPVVMRADAVALPVKRGAFHMITCECVLSLVAAPMAALAEFHRALRPGGYLVVSDIYQQTVDDAASVPWAGTGGCLRGAVDRQTWRQRMVSAGFTVVLWEDHSDLLKKLAVQLVWAGVPLSRWWGGCRENTGTARSRPGYGLLIARQTAA